MGEAPRGPAGDPPVHAGFVPWGLVKRVASLQDGQRQLLGQGPVSELWVQHERNLAPPPANTVFCHTLLWSPMFLPPALDRGMGWPGGTLAGAGGAGLCSVTLTDPQLKLYEGQGQDHAGPLPWVCESPGGWGPGQQAHLGHRREECLQQGGHSLGALHHPGTAGHGLQQPVEWRQPGGHTVCPRTRSEHVRPCNLTGQGPREERRVKVPWPGPSSETTCPRQGRSPVTKHISCSQVPLPSSATGSSAGPCSQGSQGGVAWGRVGASGVRRLLLLGG